MTVVPFPTLRQEHPIAPERDSNVMEFPLPFLGNPNAVLADARTWDLKEVLVIGRDGNGVLYVASSDGDQSTHLLLLEMAKEKVMGR